MASVAPRRPYTGCRKVLPSRHCGKQDWIPVTGVARCHRKCAAHQHVKPRTRSWPLVTAWRLAMAISLVTPTGGEPDPGRGNAILEDVAKDETAETRLRGMAAAALADSARLGRGMPVDVNRARSLYEQAIELGHKASAHNLGLFWEGVWGEEDGSIAPDRTKAMQSYRRGGDDKRCQRRLEALR